MSLTNVNSGKVADLDIQPGDIDKISLSHQSDNTQDVDTGSVDIDITAEDAHGNALDDNNIAGATTLDNADPGANYNVNATIEAATDSGNAQTSDEFLEFNTSNTQTITIGDPFDGSADITHEGIGNYTLTVSSVNDDDVGISTINNDYVNVEPDTLDVKYNTSNVGTGEAATVTVDLENGSDNLAQVSGSVDIELGLTNASGPVDLTGSVNDLTLSNGQTGTVTVSESLNDSTTAGSLTFTSNTADTGYKVNASLLSVNDVATDDPGLDVLAADAQDLKLTIDSEENAFADSPTIVQPDVDVVDSDGNVVESGQYASGETVLNYTLTSDNTDYSDSTTVTLTGPSADKQIDIGNDTGAQDLEARVGEFTLTVSQENVNDLNTDSVSVKFYPSGVTASGFSGNTVGNSESFSVDLPPETSGSVDQINADLFVEGAATQSPIGSETKLEGTVDESIDENTKATVQITQYQNSYDFNTTNAGTYELNATVATSFNNQQSITTDNETFSPDVPVQGTIAEQPSSFYGTVIDKQVDIKVTDIQDQFNNNADSTANDDFVVNISDGTSTSVTAKATDGANSYSAEGKVTLQINPSDIDNSTAVGDNAGELAIGYNGKEDGTNQFTSTSVDLTHEVLDIQEDFQPFSIPQDYTKVYAYNVSTIQYYNNTPNSASYDNSIDDLLTDTSTNEELAAGHWVDGNGSDARLGITYRTPGEGTPTTDDYSLEAGWNLVGTNYNISATKAGSHDLDDDLRNIPPIQANLSAPVYAIDSTTSGGALDVTNNGANASSLTNEEYGTYWVKLNSTDDLSRTERDVVGPAYSPVSGNR